MFKKSSLLSAALIAALAAAGAINAVAAENASIPNLASADFGWLLQGGIDFRPIPGKVPPITFDPAYPQRPGNQRGVMERMSDAENPNLKPWAQELMRKYNRDVLDGHRAFSSQSRCWPGGTPGQLLFPAGASIYFIQTPKQAWIPLAAPAGGAPRLSGRAACGRPETVMVRGDRLAITRMANSRSWTPLIFSTSKNSTSWTIGSPRTPRICTSWSDGGSSMVARSWKRLFPSTTQVRSISLGQARCAGSGSIAGKKNRSAQKTTKPSRSISAIKKSTRCRRQKRRISDCVGFDELTMPVDQWRPQCRQISFSPFRLACPSRPTMIWSCRDAERLGAVTEAAANLN